MGMFEEISSAITAAMKARDKVRLETLRAIKKDFLEAKTAPGANGELSDDAALKIIAKLVKQRKDTAVIYQENNRPELAANELAEAAIMEEYLPKQLSEEELTESLKAIIAQVGATSAKDMGKVMGVATKALAGKAEGRAISAKVKELLA
ncbi:MAG: GatB/YqeY domain-containing protein [Muribaculaceae bacterium]|nr:GatB/YqeY domain-containing protein [Muribaculaceae bacterium]MDD6020605.1 GatB/YqeY domain-containing protein [bacterium]MDD6027214.1 GatB/YqeY domain-containing protein [bacterium]MDD6130294.1 GatB/YqeY domain-containing protein [Prevotellaceae bacterium]